MDAIKTQPISTRPIGKVVVHPLVLLSIIYNYNRVAKDTRRRVVGVLVGSSFEGTVDVSNSYAVPFEEDDKDPSIWFLDNNYHESMFSMFKRINAKEHVIGWYSTGPKLRENDLDIHQLFHNYVPNPVLVIVDVQPKELGIPTKAYYDIEEAKENAPQKDKKVFVHVPSEIAAYEGERIGVEHLLRDMKETTISTLATEDVFKLLPNLSVSESIEAFAGTATKIHEQRHLPSVDILNSNNTPQPPHDNRIKLNVGGKLFETTVSTIQSGGPDSLLYAISNCTSSDSNPIFIDRDPDIFSVLLSLLRLNRLPSTACRFSKQELADEAIYYGIESQLRSVMSPLPFQGIDASVISIIRPTADALPSSFTAADDGSLWIAHGGQISVYDWKLSHSGTVRTHLEDITSIRRVWPNVAAVGSDSSAGIHFYDVSSAGHIASTYWTDPSDPRIYKAQVTAISDSPGYILSSVVCPHRENCILLIDKSTLQISSELGRQSGSSSKSMAIGKLRWIPSTGLILGSSVTHGAFGYAGYIRMWDPRSGDVVWETNEPGSGRSSRFGDPFADVDVDVEDMTIWRICSKSGDIGVADLRKLGEDPWVYIKDNSHSMRNISEGGNCFAENTLIHCYKSQLFVGREGGLEVWSKVEEKQSGVSEGSYRRNFVDKVEDSERGLINRIEGGGNRLFVSRQDVEGIEVWESSSFSGVVSVF